MGRVAKRKKLRMRGSLMVVAILLLSSATLRLGAGAGQALARDPDSDSEMARGLGTVETPCRTTEELAAMLTAFETRETRLVTQEAAIKDRMHALKIADEEVARKLDELTDAEARLRKTLALADTAAEGDLGKLTKVYESMKPKQAAALFEEMDPNFAAGFLGRMRPEAAAAIMAGLTPEAAHLYSVVLAGRNANVPKN